MSAVRGAFLIFLVLSATFARAADCKDVDWRKTSATEIKALLASSDRGRWESIETSPKNDPGHHLPPGTASALLLDAGADAKARSREGMTALDYAIANSRVRRDDPVLRRLETLTKT